VFFFKLKTKRGWVVIVYQNLFGVIYTVLLLFGEQID